MQELVADKNQLSPHAYLLNNPHVVRTKDKSKQWVKDLIKAIHSKAVVKAEAEDFPGGSSIIAWK